MINDCLEIDPKSIYFENTDNIIIMNSTNPMNLETTRNITYVILNPQQDIYLDTAKRIEYLKNLKKIQNRSSNVQNDLIFIELPFFLKYNKDNLALLIKGSIPNLTESTLVFDKNPTDFNLHGLKDFIRFINNVKMGSNIITLIEFESIKAAMLDLIYNDSDGQIELVLPQYSLQYEKELGSECTACSDILLKK